MKSVLSTNFKHVENLKFQAGKIGDMSFDSALKN